MVWHPMHLSIKSWAPLSVVSGDSEESAGASGEAGAEVTGEVAVGEAVGGEGSVLACGAAAGRASGTWAMTVPGSRGAVVMATVSSNRCGKLLPVHVFSVEPNLRMALSPQGIESRATNSGCFCLHLL